MEKNSEPLRDYGLPTSTPTEPPRVIGTSAVACPNCQCESVVIVEVAADQPLLHGGKGVGTYAGCPACPWASPMVVRATSSNPKKDKPPEGDLS